MCLKQGKLCMRKKCLWKLCISAFYPNLKVLFFFFFHKPKMESLNLKEQLTLSQHYHVFSSVT